MGELEIFLDDDVLFGKQMRAMKDNRVDVHVIGSAPHDVLFVENLLEFENEAESTGKEARRFIASLE